MKRFCILFTIYIIFISRFQFGVVGSIGLKDSFFVENNILYLLKLFYNNDKKVEPDHLNVRL